MEVLYLDELFRLFKLFHSLSMMEVHEEDDTYNSYLSQQVNVRPSMWEECRVPSEPLSSLDAISIPELCLYKRYRGRVLYGKFCVEPFTSQPVDDIVTLLVDTNANAIRVITSKLLWDTASTGEIELRFGLQRIVAIKEPLVERCTDGMPVVRLTHLSDVVFVENVNADGHSAAKPSDATTLEKIRSAGNRFFTEQNWAGAVSKYSECVHEALRMLDNNGSPETTSKDRLRYVLMLAYSNRAEARLRLQHYEDALSDADHALEIESKHMKTLVRKGKAAHGLGLFEKACEAFNAALQESPEEQSVIKSLEASTMALKQFRTGQYDLSAYYLGDGTEDVPSCADYIGPVEIRRAGYAGGGRGLFATRTVKAGELLLVSNPLAAVRHKVSVHPASGINRLFETVKFRRNLILEVADRIKTSKRQMAQLYSLCGKRGDQMAIPSMELFRPGSEWLTEDRDKFEMDVDLIREIASMNTTRGDFHLGVTNEIIHGIWSLPSFANHSCVPNIIDTFVGDARFFRASIDILEGEELTISYFQGSFLWKGVEARRQDITKIWPFVCKCARCLFEETLHPKLSKISTEYEDLVQMNAVFTGFPQKDKEKYWTRNSPPKQLAKVCDAIDVVLRSEVSELRSDKLGWIRASFIQAYVVNAQLAIDKGDIQSIILAQTLLLDSITSVSIGPYALQEASNLLAEVERRFSKRSQSYRQTLVRVRSVYNAFFGNLPKKTFHKLLRTLTKFQRF